MARSVTYAHRYKRPPRKRTERRIVLSALCGVVGLVAAEAALCAENTFDGTYTGKRVLTKGPNAPCVSSEDMSATIRGGVLTFTNSALHNFTIGLDPRLDGSFSVISRARGGRSVLIKGRIVGDDLDADVTNGRCEHHWHLKRSR
jgi:hypothetical protein